VKCASRRAAGMAEAQPAALDAALPKLAVY
jgi:hypothetical protein